MNVMALASPPTCETGLEVPASVTGSGLQTTLDQMVSVEASRVEAVAEEGAEAALANGTDSAVTIQVDLASETDLAVTIWVALASETVLVTAIALGKRSAMVLGVVVSVVDHLKVALVEGVQVGEALCFIDGSFVFVILAFNVHSLLLISFLSVFMDYCNVLMFIL